MESEHSARQIQPTTHGAIGGPSALVPAATALHAHGVTLNQGSFTQAGRDITIQHHYHTQVPGPSIVDILEILSLVPNLRKVHLDVLSKATNGTGVWFLKTKNFLLWVDLEGNVRILWGTGIPGAGKSVMASIVIRDLEARAAAAGGSICLAYVYFRYSDAANLTLKRVLEILVKQTVERHADCALLAEQVYARHFHEKTLPTEAELLELLDQFTKTKAATFYILDALDEAPERLRVALIKSLTVLNVRLFITSRPLKDVEGRFHNTCSFPIIAQEGDLDLHITREIANSSVLEELLEEAEDSFKDEVVSLVKKNCGGMFLHASLQLTAISQCTSTQDVMDILQEFPTEIDSVYRRTWDRICRHNPRNILLAKAVLIWVLTATRSMSIEELRHAIATSPDTRQFERKRLVPAATLVSLCCGLITVEEETKLVRLVHYTAQGTLQELLHQDFPYPHSLLAAVCMTHLTECGFQDTTISSEEEYTTALQSDPLLAYASHAWATHVQESLNVPEIHRQAAEFISKCRAFPSFIGANGAHEWDIIGPLHILAVHHLPLDLQHEETIGEPNVETKIVKESPLKLASWHGNEGMVKSLLELPDIQVNYVDSDGTSALMLAAEQGHGRIVDMLLARTDIQVNMIDVFRRAALVSAARNGHEGTVSALLTRRDTQVNLVNSAGWSALVSAITNGHEGTAKLLLAHPKVDVNLANSVNGSGWTALMEAADKGHEGIVKLLLERPDIEANLVDRNGEPAFFIAARRGHESIVKLFLARPKVQVNIANKQGWPVLVVAIADDCTDIVKLLLAHPDVNVNSTNAVDGSGWTALMEAIDKGREGITRLLLEHPEIEVNSVDNNGWSALVLAAGHGYERIVQLLLAHPEIQVNTVDNEGLSALMWAASQGHIAIIKLLLACSKIQVNLVDHSGRSALRLATSRNFEGIVKLLMSHLDIEVNSTDLEGTSPLMEAAHGGLDNTLSVLLAHPDIDVNAVNDAGRSALMLAVLTGCESTVRLLLAHPDICIDSVDDEGYSAVMLAEREHHGGCVALLNAFTSSRVIGHSFHQSIPREELPDELSSECSEEEFHDADDFEDQDNNSLSDKL